MMFTNYARPPFTHAEDLSVTSTGFRTTEYQQHQADLASLYASYKRNKARMEVLDMTLKSSACVNGGRA